MSVFLDTNILIYTISTADSDLAKQAAAIALVERPDCVLSVQVFQEFYTQQHAPRGRAPFRTLRRLPS
jgi:predicted nucleic acid-binding protein